MKVNNPLGTKSVLSTDEIGIKSLVTFGYAVGSEVQMPMVSHYHKDKIEITIIVDGIQRYTASNVKYTLYGKDVFVACPNEEHSSEKSDQQLNEILWFQIDMTDRKNFLGLDPIKSAYILNKIHNLNGRKIQIDQELINGFLSAFNFLSNQSVANKIKGQAIFTYCFVNLLEKKPVLTTFSSDIEYAKEYILMHVRETIDNDALMYRSNLSASQFKAKFKEQVGCIPREYIKHAKIDRAKDEVAHTKRSFVDIAYDYSFSSYNFFCVAFKQYTGLTPKEYRKKFFQK